MKHRFILYIFIFLMSSCSDDQSGVVPEPGITGDEVKVSFTLSVPAPTEVQTRGMADNEYTIREIDILVFHDNDFIRLASGRDLVKTAGGYRFEASLLPTSKQVRLFFIANISATLHENINRLETQGGTITAEEAKKLAYVRYENFISRRDIFPMSGELRMDGLGENTVFPEVKMMRAFARVDVVAHENISNRFQLEKATVHRMNDLFQIAPDDDAFSRDASGNYISVSRTSVPDAAVKDLISQEYKAVGNSITHIYLPEGEACDPVTDEPTCLIIQGKYQNNSSPSYYRVDLGPKGSAGEAIRNHKYTLTITSVTGPGKQTIADALEEASEDINTYIIWEEDGSHTIFDKNGKYLTTSKRTFSLHFARAAMDTVSIDTDFADTYTLEWADENGDPTGETAPIGPGGMMSNNDFKVRISADGKTIYATALKENDGTTHKVQRLFGRAGSILFTMTIDQHIRGERTYVKLYNPLGLNGDLGDEVMNAVSTDPTGNSVLRDLIRNEDLFGINGIVSFDGFKISGQNYQLPITSYLIRMFDVVLIGHGIIYNNDATTARILKQWLEDTGDNQKVLILYTSNTTLVETFGTHTTSLHNFSYTISGDATDTFLKGPFGEVTAHKTVNNMVVVPFNIMSRAANPHLTPLLTDPTGDYMVIAADLNKRILYMSDFYMHSSPYSLLTGNGKVETDLDLLFANIWAWVAETVLGDVYDPDVAR